MNSISEIGFLLLCLFNKAYSRFRELAMQYRHYLIALAYSIKGLIAILSTCAPIAAVYLIFIKHKRSSIYQQYQWTNEIDRLCFSM